MMKHLLKIAVITGALALTAARSLAANPHEGSPPDGKRPTYNPGAPGTPPPVPRRACRPRRRPTAVTATSRARARNT